MEVNKIRYFVDACRVLLLWEHKKQKSLPEIHTVHNRVVHLWKGHRSRLSTWWRGSASSGFMTSGCVSSQADYVSTFFYFFTAVFATAWNAQPTFKLVPRHLIWLARKKGSEKSRDRNWRTLWTVLILVQPPDSFESLIRVKPDFSTRGQGGLELLVGIIIAHFAWQALAS